MKTYLVHRRKKGIVSWLIRLITRSWSSHTAILIHYKDFAFIYESDGGIVRKVNYTFWVKDFEIELQKIDLTSEKQFKLGAVLEAQLGKGYDFKATIVDQLIYQLRGKWTGHTASFASDKFNCSEFVAYCLNEVNGIYPEWYKTTPADLYNEKRYITIYKGNAKNINY